MCETNWLHGATDTVRVRPLPREIGEPTVVLTWSFLGALFYAGGINETGGSDDPRAHSRDLNKEGKPYTAQTPGNAARTRFFFCSQPSRLWERRIGGPCLGARPAV